MTIRSFRAARFAGSALVAGAMSLLWNAGCGGSPSNFTQLYFSPLFGERTTTGTDPGSVSTPGSDFFAGGNRADVDPCAEPQNRKIITVSLRNFDNQDFIHYFLAFVAFVDTDDAAGAVCEEDIAFYTSFGYEFVPADTLVPFGNFCVSGPALLYFHGGGAFRGAGGSGNANLVAGIAPAQGTAPSFDNFFTASGAQVPVPDLILWHNPGTGGGAQLKVSVSDPAPCATDTTVVNVDPDCAQDAFYYVDTGDRFSGSNTLGLNSGRRTPNEIQGTGCECGAFSPTNFAQELAPSGTSAAQSRCNEFLRGGRIDFAFIRDDRDPPIPQLLWRVTDSAGSVAHEFDPRADIP